MSKKVKKHLDNTKCICYYIQVAAETTAKCTKTTEQWNNLEKSKREIQEEQQQQQLHPKNSNGQRARKLGDNNMRV